MSDIHSCGYFCSRPECVKAQRDELRDRLVAAELRLNDDGSLDELVGSGFVHLEQMSANHWWMALETPLGRYTVGLHARGKITAFHEFERGVVAALSAPPAEPQELPATVKECLPVAAKLLRELKNSLRHGPGSSTCYACEQEKEIDAVLATLDPKEGEQT